METINFATILVFFVSGVLVRDLITGENENGLFMAVAFVATLAVGNLIIPAYIVGRVAYRQLSPSETPTEQ